MMLDAGLQSASESPVRPRRGLTRSQELLVFLQPCERWSDCPVDVRHLVAFLLSQR